MFLDNWFPALTSTLFLLAVWLAHEIITTRLTRSVQHEFDRKLEMLRTDLRNSEQSFTADLRSKEAQITALRSGAISGMLSRQVALDKRRLKAVDQLWSAVHSLASAKAASAMMSVIKFDAAARESAKNPRAREVFKMMGATIDPNKMPIDESWKARPYISPPAWALFSAYRAIVWLAVTQLHVLKVGLDMPEVVNTKYVEELVKAALPHHSEYVAKHGPAAYHNLLGELEVLLLIALRQMLEGKESDEASVKQAATIVKLSESLMVETVTRNADLPQEAPTSAA
jgi:hypothetical protein